MRDRFCSAAGRDPVPDSVLALLSEMQERLYQEATSFGLAQYDLPPEDKLVEAAHSYLFQDPGYQIDRIGVNRSDAERALFRLNPLYRPVGTHILQTLKRIMGIKSKQMPSNREMEIIRYAADNLRYGLDPMYGLGPESYWIETMNVGGVDQVARWLWVRANAHINGYDFSEVGGVSINQPNTLCA